ncbi:DUF202 domain-containing protein [Mycobacterium sp.]|uniref:DUF202 domain-containing protein n=1 Tax=Mycobacterium sp. TaxID=1785 RepID=UPI002C090D16|nr:DUF202 domain-containing protein [Mycobacterium sp.]HTQ16796.1 DUF202 domain-containing protein [Mycobacterium sp.]
MSAPDRGLQAERTTLAWTRTSFAFLVNGALLAFKNLNGGPVALIPTVLAAIVALCAYLIAIQRERTLAIRPLPPRITPRRQVYIIGMGTLTVVVVTAVVQLI